jgi:patatin-like phospholipase/acyl hydrolase
MSMLPIDGGGVRGYSSLLILEHLMEEIKRCEKGDTKDFNELESSLSCPWTDCTKDTNADFLMHHYVDYFVGTSTGGSVYIISAVDTF